MKVHRPSNPTTGHIPWGVDCGSDNELCIAKFRQIEGSRENHWTIQVSVQSLSHVQLFVTPWPTAYQASRP